METSNIKKIFFIGIGGIGISSLAHLALSRNIEVSGINDEDSPATLDPLRAKGAKIIYEAEFKELPEADMYVYSDAWIYRGPQILEKAKAIGKPVLSYFEALGEFAKEYKVIAVAGTHGKTTTTAMIGEMLIGCGLDPTVVVGSLVKSFGSNFRKGNGAYLVVEADEYNRHFLQFSPFITVITNIEADHLDCYKDLSDIQSAFKQLISQTSGRVVANPSDENTKAVLGENFVDYTKYIDQVPVLLVPGVHNRMNASAALTVADALGVDLSKAGEELSKFQGTWRRLDKKGETKEGVVVYDDYAHHPTEIRASLSALRELYPKDSHQIVVLFQPHLYSRTKALFKEFAQSFSGADRVYLLPIYYAREDKDESISSEILADAIDLNGVTAYAFANFEDAEEVIKTLNLSSGTIFVTMGAGEAYKVADKVFTLHS